MKLYDLKEILISEYYLKDVNLKYSRTIEVNIRQIQDKYLKQIEIINIDRNNIIFNVNNFINANKKEIENFYINSDYDDDIKDYSINQICKSENLGDNDIKEFIDYDLLNFLLGE